MIRLHGLGKSYEGPDGRLVTALAPLDLAIADGEFLVVLGSNGSGKSTLLGLVSGAIPPTTGRIEFGSTDVSAWPEHRRAALIARAFQNPAVGTAANLTVAENLQVASGRGSRRWLRIGLGRGRRADFRDQLAAFRMGLEDRLDTPVSVLSGGQRQVLTLLMATLVPSQIWLLDEHTAALDPETAAVVMGITNRLIRERGITALMVTHSMEDAAHFGDRALVLHRGVVAREITAAERAGTTAADYEAIVRGLYHPGR